MKEIGGYIELDTSCGREYHSDALPLNSARQCLEYIIKAKNIKKLYIPIFLCKSVQEICIKCGCKYEYYSIENLFDINFNEKLFKDEYLYIVNYYGQLDNKTILKYKQKHLNIIIDNVQAFFQMPVKDVDTLYSCRKFFGVPDGGYLYTQTKLDNNLPNDYSYNKMEHILGRFETNAQDFYGFYSENELKFKEQQVKNMSKLTHNLLRGVNYCYAEDIRTKNFEFLHERLRVINKLNLTIPDGAFMYPLYVENGNELKSRLIENQIYVPTLWKDVFEVTNNESIEWDFTENIVPLPIDQRYNIEDMEYMLDIIEENM